MNVHTRLSAKGQVVIPKAVRERLGWTEGAELRIVEHAGSVTLEPVPSQKSGRTTEEILAAIDARHSYRGPPLSIEDMDQGVREAVTRRYFAKMSTVD